MPIKRNENIVPLSQDHHFSLLFGWKIRQGLKKDVDVKRIIAYVHYFERTHLLPHFHEEELLLFNPYKNNSLVAKGLKDHQNIKNIIIRLTEDVSNEQQLYLLKSLADEVENHIRFEERELFPALEKILSTEELLAVGAALSISHQVKVVDDYADEFWIEQK